LVVAIDFPLYGKMNTDVGMVTKSNVLLFFQRSVHDERLMKLSLSSLLSGSDEFVFRGKIKEKS
jgi:hypothetical protein